VIGKKADSFEQTRQDFLVAGTTRLFEVDETVTVQDEWNQ